MTDVLLRSDSRNMSQHVAAVSRGFGAHSLRSALSSGSPRAKGIGRFVIGNGLGPRHEPNDAKWRNVYLSVQVQYHHCHQCHQIQCSNCS